MAVNQKKWWRNIFAPSQNKKADVLKDIEAVREFLGDLDLEANKIRQELDKLWELQKESRVNKPELLHINLESQAKVIEKVLECYSFFQDDADINGNRIKLIAREFLKRAQKEGLKDLVKEKKKDKKWQFRW